uniref:Uncharacterized protein n=1 Tax=Anguilla anguilla TaxID=7936 RepID=A0A0E9VMY4_ANGAN
MLTRSNVSVPCWSHNSYNSGIWQTFFGKAA